MRYLRVREYYIVFFWLKNQCSLCTGYAVFRTWGKTLTLHATNVSSIFCSTYFLWAPSRVTQTESYALLEMAQIASPQFVQSVWLWFSFPEGIACFDSSCHLCFSKKHSEYAIDTIHDGGGRPSCSYSFALPLTVFFSFLCSIWI